LPKISNIIANIATKTQSTLLHHGVAYSGPQTQPVRKSLGKNLAQKCLEHWNAAVGIDEGKITSANQRSSKTVMTGSGYTVEHRHFENCCSI